LGIVTIPRYDDGSTIWQKKNYPNAHIGNFNR
jgi:hypothetical protein